MRKSILAAAGAAALVVLTACSGGGTGEGTEAGGQTPAAEGEAPARADADLVIWSDEPRTPVIEAAAAGFAEANGITVAVQTVETDRQGNFVTANAAGNGPDLVVGAHDWTGNLVQNGAIDPLPLTEADLGRFTDIAAAGASYDGQVYGLPFATESLVLYRNTDLAPAAPATLEDLVAQGRAAVDSGAATTPASIPVDPQGAAFHLNPLYTSAGGYLFGENADGSLNPADVGVGQQGSLTAAQKMAELAQAGVLSTAVTTSNSISLFTEGDTPFLVSGPWALADVETSGIPYEVSTVPGFAGLAPARSFTGVQLFYVASGGQNKAFAQEFVTTTLNTPEVQQDLYEADPRPPAMTEVLDAATAADPQLAVFGRASADGLLMPAIPAMAAVWEPLGSAETAIVDGADPAESMSSAGRTIVDAIG